jgi:hypothetical protein
VADGGGACARAAPGAKSQADVTAADAAAARHRIFRTFIDDLLGLAARCRLPARRRALKRAVRRCNAHAARAAGSASRRAMCKLRSNRAMR